MESEVRYLLATSVRLLMITGMNTAMAVFFYDMMLEKRRSLRSLVYYLMGKTFFYGMLVQYILRYYYGEEQWMQIILVLSTWLFAVLSFAMVYRTFQGGLLKIMIVCDLGEIAALFVSFPVLACFNLLEGKEELWMIADPFRLMDLAVPVVDTILILLIYHFMAPLFGRFRKYELRHRKMLWILVVGYVLLANMAVITSYDKMVVLVSVNVAVSCVSVFLIFSAIIRHQRRLKERRKFLAVQQEALRMHYAVIENQIHEMEKNQRRIDNQMEEISRIKDAASADGKIAAYLQELKKNYDGIHLGIYCDDWMIDAMLCAQNSVLKRQGIKFACSMQECDIGKIEEQDFIQFILKLLDLGAEMNQKADPPGEKRVYLGVSAVKNQLMIQFLTTCGNEIQISKTDIKKTRMLKKMFREYLEKYQGDVDVQKKETVGTKRELWELQLTMRLQRG